VEFHPQIVNDFPNFCRRDSAQKQYILRYFQSLSARGFRHVLLNIEQPCDLWVAQLLLSAKTTCGDAFHYTIGLWQYEANPCDWIETTPCDWESILKNAHRVIYRKFDWHEGRYCAQRLYVSLDEKWYDACDRCPSSNPRHRYAVFTGRERSMQEMLSELFVRQYQVLLGVAFQLARNEDDALDLMQDLAETIARNDRPAASIEHPMAFFRTCLRNARINAIKKAQREVPSEPEVFAKIPAGDSVEENVVGGAAMAWLKKELEQYPPEMREAFYLYFFDGYSLDEVAKKLSINKNTLSQRFVRIRTKLVKKAADQSLFFALMVLFLLRPR
jgi:RNA polymerase sigma-70 factor (ECF subfamily)